MVKSVTERFDRSRSEVSDGKRTHVRCFLVATDSPVNGTAVALTASDANKSIPAYHSDHPTYDGTIVTGLSSDPYGDSDRFFIVTVNYAEPTIEEQQKDADPLTLPAEITYGASESTEAYFYDRSPEPNDWNAITYGPWKGQPMVNTAGDAFANYMERESSELMITVSTNEQSYNPNMMDRYSHTVNDSIIEIDGVGYAPGTLKLSPITASRQTQNDVPFYKVTKILKARRQGWNDVLLDEGLNQLDYEGDELPARGEPVGVIPIFSAAGTKVDKPWPLNGKGKQRPNPTDPAATIKRRPYEWVDWGSLDFTGGTGNV